MRATVMHKAHDVRVENVPDAAFQESAEAVITTTRARIRGSTCGPTTSCMSPVKATVVARVISLLPASVVLSRRRQRAET